MSLVVVRRADSPADIRCAFAIRAAAFSQLGGNRHTPFDTRPDTRSFLATTPRGDGVAAGWVVSGRSGSLPSAGIFAQMGWPLNPPGFAHWDEFTRFGTSPQYQRTRTGLAGFLGMAGAAVCHGLKPEAPRLHWLMTMMPGLVQSLDWVPYEGLHRGPFQYRGGPNTLEPIWAATVYLPEVPRALQLVRPRLYTLMFPGGVPSGEWPAGRSDDDLRELIAANRAILATHISQAGERSLPVYTA
ncbi:MAG TPA: hypothetical protein VMT30_04145 [Candidatus Saccharimonadia bacterium]|nr:hypothetical protein [Candidatus Saccharimonadia bacterium]